jgi:hypothetical protein
VGQGIEGEERVGKEKKENNRNSMKEKEGEKNK